MMANTHSTVSISPSAQPSTPQAEHPSRQPPGALGRGASRTLACPGVAQQLGFACGPEHAAVAAAASLRPQVSSPTTSSRPLQLSADTRGMPQASPRLAAHRSPLSPQAGPPVSSDPRYSRCLADTAEVARSAHTDSGPTVCQA